MHSAPRTQLTEIEVKRQTLTNLIICKDRGRNNADTGYAVPYLNLWDWGEGWKAATIKLDLGETSALIIKVRRK
jgi:hypothetical protein